MNPEEIEKIVPEQDVDVQNFPDMSRMSYQARKMFLNRGKPCISPIYYSVTFKDGSMNYGTSTAKSNFSLEEFEQETRRSFHLLDWMSFYDNKDAWMQAQKEV